jgi:hypothetical protein
MRYREPPRPRRRCVSPLVARAFAAILVDAMPLAAMPLAAIPIVVAAVACTPDTRPETVGASRAPVVYGADDRVEPYEHPDARMRALAENVIAMQVDAAALDERDPRAVRVVAASTLGAARELCEGERFAEQPEPGQCSGTLIGPRLLLTAGHCMSSPGDCSPSRPWVFGYRYVAPGVLAGLTADDVYRCVRVVALRETATLDFAVIELDRPVVGRLPAPIATPDADGGAPVRVGDPVTLIGHPNGIPMKIAGGGVVLWVNATSARATVDAFEGNSGSGVFDANARLVALLDSGADDYVWTGSCFAVDVLDPAASEGEGLTLVKPAIDAACRTLGMAEPLCACEAPPCATSVGPDGGASIGDAGASAPTASGGRAGCASAPGDPRGPRSTWLGVAFALVFVARACARRIRRSPGIRRYSHRCRSTCRSAVAR